MAGSKLSRPAVTPAQVIGLLIAAVPIVASLLHAFGVYDLSVEQQHALSDTLGWAAGAAAALFVSDAGLRAARNHAHAKMATDVSWGERLANALKLAGPYEYTPAGVVDGSAEAPSAPSPATEAVTATLGPETIAGTGSGPHRGIDLYSGNGHVNFHAVRRAGHRFVYVKATEGVGYQDAGYLVRAAAARAAGLHVGFYHFLRPRPGRSGKDEARYFWEAVKGFQGGEGGKELLRLVLDVEVTGIGREMTAQTAREDGEGFMGCAIPSDRALELAGVFPEGVSRSSAGATRKYVREAARELKRLSGHEPVIYTYPAFLPDWGRELARYPLWIAHYGAASPTVPAPWKGWKVWQHSSTARVPGVSGNVDHNRCPRLRDLILERDRY